MTLQKPNRTTRFKIAEQAAREAGILLKEHFGKKLTVQYKGEIDPVTNLDLQAQALIKGIIRAAFPEDDILAEEGEQDRLTRAERWIVDPLDGTVNYLHGYPCFGVSIAFEYEGAVNLGVVYQPILDEMFVAQKGKGATLNGQTIRVSETSDLNQALLVTGFPYDIRTTGRNNLDLFCRFALKAQGIRRDGSAALDLCYLAAGRFEGFWEGHLKPWDTAAGVLMVEEAGGKISRYDHRPFDNYYPELLASNGKIHKPMLEAINGKA